MQPYEKKKIYTKLQPQICFIRNDDSDLVVQHNIQFVIYSVTVLYFILLFLTYFTDPYP